MEVWPAETSQGTPGGGGGGGGGGGDGGSGSITSRYQGGALLTQE